MRIVIAFRGHGSSLQLSLMYELAFVGNEWREQGESATRSLLKAKNVLGELEKCRGATCLRNAQSMIIHSERCVE